MRLEELHVAGFGRLRDLSAAFSPRLTVILGGNESGKSTVHRAVRCALYGLDAGGQGRSVERSDWSRWRPWTPGPYGVVLTYGLENGRRFRVARRLDLRQQVTQVRELGGGDVTAEMRVGRVIAPGLVQLGIDEPVFCATAWLGDDGLRSGSPEAPDQRSVALRLQEAIERLADTGSGVTAAGAVARLREAMARVGSERRSASPLGMASSRLRQLDHELEAARRRRAALLEDQERLVRLEEVSASAEERRADCEREWLLGRVARITTVRADLAAATIEARVLREAIEATECCARFPLEDEERVISLGGELSQAMAAAAESGARALAASEPLRAARRRRAEIAEGRRALGTPISLEHPVVGWVPAFERDLAAESRALQRAEELRRAQACRQQLRRQLASTGLVGIPAGDADRVELLFHQALGPAERSSAPWLLAMVLALLGGAAVCLVAGHALPALLCGGGSAVTAALAVTRHLLGDSGRRARGELARLLPGSDSSRQGLEILASRLPVFRRLHSELVRFEAVILAGEREMEAARLRLAALADAGEAALQGLGLARPEGDASARAHTIEVSAARACAALTALQQAIDRRHRWEELGAEDDQIHKEEEALAVIVEEAAHRAARVRELEARLGQLLERSGLPAGLPAPEGVEAFRSACEARRRHEAATARLVQVEQRITAVGCDDATLARQAAAFTRELRDRGVDGATIARAAPLEAARLDALEREVDSARAAAASAATEAAALRARIAGALENLPRCADLADERASCLAARDRGLRQLAALERARELVEATARDVHRHLAPRLAECVATRLSLITDGRYRMVDVDTGHFEVSLLGGDSCELVPLELLSRGTRDQVSLLLRLALSEVLGDRGERVPLLLDEPLLSADQDRRSHALDFLARLSETHQVVMTTSDEKVAAVMAGLLGEACRTISLGSPASALDSPTLGARAVAVAAS